MFYVIIRGGILSVNAQPADLNYFGIAAISVRAGLVATEGTKKIRDIFMTLFGTIENREKGEEIIQEAKQQIQQAEEKIEKVEEKIKEKGEQETEQDKEKFK
jgi:5-deoxy-D-glucuronate isomerase